MSYRPDYVDGTDYAFDGTIPVNGNEGAGGGAAPNASNFWGGFNLGNALSGAANVISAFKGSSSPNTVIYQQAPQPTEDNKSGKGWMYAVIGLVVVLVLVVALRK